MGNVASRRKRPIDLADTLTSAGLIEAVHQLEGFTLKQRTLEDWIDRGLITPTIRPGQGSSVRWTVSDLARVRLIAKLRNGGIPGQRITPICNYLDAELREVLQPGSKAMLVVETNARTARAYVVREGQPDVEVPSGQQRLKFKLDSLFRGNEEAARRWAAA